MKNSILFFVSMLVFVSCKKYENGPSLTLLSKKERAANIWSLQMVKENGTDKTNDYKNLLQNYKLNLDKNNMKYTITWKALGLIDYSETGSWEFSSDKLYLVLKKDATSNSTSTTSNWKILKLKEKELWVEYSSSNNILTEIHFVP
jgi:hypothetical protein